MQRIDYVIFYFFLMSFAASLYAGQYGPNMLFQKPYDPENYIGNFTGTCCAGRTDQSYNHAGRVVPFLKDFGKEDILLEFIDPLINHNEVYKIGTVDFAGQLNFQSINLSYYKNIMHHMFLGLGTLIQNLNIDIIESNIELSTILTPREEKLFEVFITKIPKNLNTSGILSTYLELGYNRKFKEFKSMEFLQLYLKGALVTPQWVEGSSLNLLQYPFTGNATFGYQVMAILTMNLTPHLNFGLFTSVNSFQSKFVETPYNEHIINNKLLINKKTFARYTPGTVYNGAVYWELDNFLSHVTLTAGLNFMYGTPRKIKPISSATYNVVHVPNVHLSTNATLDAWNITSLFFELDYNFLTEKNPEGPCITLFFNTPLSGYHFPKINGIGGEFGLSFNYYI